MGKGKRMEMGMAMRKGVGAGVGMGDGGWGWGSACRVLGEMHKGGGGPLEARTVPALQKPTDSRPHTTVAFIARRTGSGSCDQIVSVSACSTAYPARTRFAM